MKKALITKIVVLSLVTVFLVGALVYGFSNGFGFVKYINKEIITTTTNGKTYEYTQEVGDINTIKIDWVAGDIDVKYYSGDVIKITESAAAELDKDSVLRLEADEDSLKIKWNDSTSFFKSIFNILSKKLVVEIPETMKIEKIDVGGTSSDIKLNGIYAEDMIITSTSGSVEGVNTVSDSLTMKSTSGQVIGTDVKTNTLTSDTTSGEIEFTGSVILDSKLSTVSGSISAKGSFSKLKVNSVSGEIEAVTNLQCENIKADSVSGSISITVPEDTEAKIKYGSISGDFTSTLGVNSSGKSGDFTLGNSKNEITIGTTSGNMNLGAGGKAAVQEVVSTDRSEPETESKAE